MPEGVGLLSEAEPVPPTPHPPLRFPLQAWVAQD